MTVTIKLRLQSISGTRPKPAQLINLLPIFFQYHQDGTSLCCVFVCNGGTLLQTLNVFFGKKS